MKLKHLDNISKICVLLFVVTVILLVLNSAELGYNIFSGLFNRGVWNFILINSFGFIVIISIALVISFAIRQSKTSNNTRNYSPET